MALWWDSLALIQQIMAVIALPATLLLVIQVIILLFGLGGDSALDGGDAGDIGDLDGDAGGLDADGADFDADTDVDAPDSGGDFHADSADLGPADDFSPFSLAGLRLVTFRGVIAFLTIAGWGGVMLIDLGVPALLAVVLAVLMGAAASYLLAVALRAALRLQSDGTIRLKNAIGKVGTVYIPVPENRTGNGKITLNLQERFIEADAVTYNKHAIGTNKQVVVIGIEDETLVVEPVMQIDTKQQQ